MITSQDIQMAMGSGFQSGGAQENEVTYGAFVVFSCRVIRLCMIEEYNKSINAKMMQLQSG
jgi:hypothetical protein